MSAFTKDLDVRQIGDDLWVLEEDFEYHIGYLGSAVRIAIPTGEFVDLASVPTYLRWLVDKRGQWDQPCALHDTLYRQRVIWRVVCDIIFLQAMKVRKVPAHRRWGAFILALLFGWYRWYFPQY